MHQDAPYIQWVKEYKIADQSEPHASLLRLRRLDASPFARPPHNHFHPEVEIALFLNGSGTYMVNHQVYPIESGDVLLCASMDQHCFSEIRGPEGLTFLTIHFEPRFIWSRGSNMFDAKFLRIFESLGKGIEYRMPRGPVTDSVRSLILSMEEEFEKQETDYEAMVKALLLHMLVLLNRLVPVEVLQEQSTPSSANLMQIEKAMSYIHTHLTESLTLEELANAAHMSPCYFSAIFKRLNGLSPWSYITAKRIELARSLLAESGMTVLDVAHACGYNNTANFNRAFKQITNTSPSQYRKVIRTG